MEKKPVFAGKSNPYVSNPSTGGNEKDIDDLVHEEPNKEALDSNEEEDPDDKVHRVNHPGNSPMNEAHTGMEDPDDLVHGLNEGDEG